MKPFSRSSDHVYPEKNRSLWKASLALLATLLPGLSSAHDIWLSPEQSVIEKGATLTVHQFVGPELAGAEQGSTAKELPLLRRITTRFDLVTNNRTLDLLGELPDEAARPVVQPILQRRMDTDGLALVAMDHAFVYDQYSSEKFLEYLAHEEYPLVDHDHWGEQQEQSHPGGGQHEHNHHVHAGHTHGQQQRPDGQQTVDFQTLMGSRPEQRERYRRFLKALVQVGTPGQEDLYRRRLGQVLEILLLQNPYQLDPGTTLDVQVIFQDQPLAGALVKAYNRGAGGSVTNYKARTSTDGIARFKLNHKGFWLFRLVHLRPCDEDTDAVGCEVAVWESDWASYSFRLD